jgi:Tfp pilus assembly protein FimT
LNGRILRSRFPVRSGTRLASRPLRWANAGDLVPFLLPLLSVMATDHQPFTRSPQSGYSFVELVITVGMIVVLTTWAMPSFLNYYRSARVRAGARAVSAYLNEARQLAIRNNSPVCVVRSSASTMQYRTATGTTCNATVIAAAGLANSSSNIRLPDNVTLSTATVIFGNLGNANTAGSYTVTDAVSSRTLTVTVAGSGRVTIGP